MRSWDAGVHRVNPPGWLDPKQGHAIRFCHSGPGLEVNQQTSLGQGGYPRNRLLPSPLHQLQEAAQEKATQQHPGIAPQKEGLQGDGPHLRVRGRGTMRGWRRGGGRRPLSGACPGGHQLDLTMKNFLCVYIVKFSLHELRKPFFSPSISLGKQQAVFWLPEEQAMEVKLKEGSPHS